VATARLTEVRERLADQLAGVPDRPGVYRFRDADGEVLYVGKAVSLRKRVQSYFRRRGAEGGQYGYKTAELVDRIDAIEWVVTQNEPEALLMEQNFIKRHRPAFNVRLRDDKSYPYIAISLDEQWPRVYFTREQHRRDRVYYGPYSSAYKVRETVDLLNKVFLFRTCRGAEPGRPGPLPCLDYHIKRCVAPCATGYTTKVEYDEIIAGVQRFLSGRERHLDRRIEAQMRDASAALEYERAAALRNRLQAVRHLAERQRAQMGGEGAADVIGIALDRAAANAQVYLMRDGTLVDRQSFYLTNPEERPAAEVVENFLLQYYAEAPAVPPQVVVPALEGMEVDALSEILSERRGTRVEIRAAERGDKRRLVELATRNAELALDQERLKAERTRTRRTEALEDLRVALQLERPPFRIEGYDISNIMETHAVGSMVVMEGGAPKKAHYRKFAIRHAGWSDFDRMREVIRRRFSPRGESDDASFSAVPDLVMIDGGKGQLSAAVAALGDLRSDAPDVAVCALAKRHEELYVPGQSRPVHLPKGSPGSLLLQRLRDEAHRFAITFHRQRRDKEMTGSLLDVLPGVGPARKKALLAHFGSVEEMLAAAPTQFEAVPGLPAKVGRAVYEHVHRMDPRG
jgi:excinuclease ABC subunit C